MVMKIDARFIRYLMAGGVNTLFGYSVFALLVYIGADHYIAIFFSSIAGILFNFQTFGVLVFRNNSRRLIWKFVAVYCFLYLVNVTLLYFLVALSINVYVSNAIAVMFTAGIGFYLNRRYVFSK
jgi:putative flippase GtrA